MVLSGMTSTRFNGHALATLGPMNSMYVADLTNNRIHFFYNGQSASMTIAWIIGISEANATILSR